MAVQSLDYIFFPYLVPETLLKWARHLCTFSEYIFNLFPLPGRQQQYNLQRSRIRKHLPFYFITPPEDQLRLTNSVSPVAFFT